MASKADGALRTARRALLFYIRREVMSHGQLLLSMRLFSLATDD